MLVDMLAEIEADIVLRDSGSCGRRDTWQHDSIQPTRSRGPNVTQTSRPKGRESWRHTDGCEMCITSLNAGPFVRRGGGEDTGRHSF